MLLSIVIVHYNTYHLTKGCLESISRYCDLWPYEVILVNNGSFDQPIDEFEALFSGVVLIQNAENVGFSRAVNLGVSKSIGKYILLLNSDVELCMRGIEDCVKKLENDWRIGVLGCKLLYPSGQIQHSANDFPSVRNELIELFRLNKIFRDRFKLNGFYFDHLDEREVDWVWGTFFLFPKEILKVLDMGRFPEDFFMYFEDVQWCQAVRKAGYKVVYYPQYKVFHHLAGSSESDFVDKKKIFLLMQHEKSFLKKEKGSFYLFVLYVFRAFKYFSLRKRDFLRTGWLFLRNSVKM